MENHTTSLAIIEVTEALDGSNCTCTLGVPIDLSKASDTINYKILLAKLYHYGIRGRPIALDWFRSYFTHTFRQVSYDGIFSILAPILCGVP